MLVALRQLPGGGCGGEGELDRGARLKLNPSEPVAAAMLAEATRRAAPARRSAALSLRARSDDFVCFAREAASPRRTVGLPFIGIGLAAECLVVAGASKCGVIVDRMHQSPDYGAQARRQHVLA